MHRPSATRPGQDEHDASANRTAASFCMHDLMWLCSMVELQQLLLSFVVHADKPLPPYICCLNDYCHCYCCDYTVTDHTLDSCLGDIMVTALALYAMES